MTRPRQLTLSVQLNDSATFTSYWCASGSDTEQTVSALEAFANGPVAAGVFYLWGGAGSGRSHLLQAACARAMESGQSSQYLPLDLLKHHSPEDVFEGMDQLDLLALDDVDQVLGQPAWEEALFHLFNRLQQAGKKLLMSAPCAPSHLHTALPDLHSRLAWGLIYRLENLDDAGKAEALQHRAKRRGLALSAEVLGYLLNHSQRSTAALFELLDQLDDLSLEQKRRLSVPLVKQVLGAG